MRRLCDFLLYLERGLSLCLFIGGRDTIQYMFLVDMIVDYD
jgi:hypothetical protein